MGSIWVRPRLPRLRVVSKMAIILWWVHRWVYWSRTLHLVIPVISIVTIIKIPVVMECVTRHIVRVTITIIIVLPKTGT